MKKLPLAIQNFREIIEGDYVYVDKTQYVYRLINDVSYYFLSRPRRFGKSLLLDTISEAFSGDRELFKGLWIYDSDYSFEKHPVIRLDMSNIANETPEMLRSALAAELNKRAEEEGFDISAEIPSDIFKFLIEEMHEKYNQTVVVLIDEYDKPILDHLDDIETAKANIELLGGFYGILKSMDPHLKLTFTTGITKFARVEMAPAFNNLSDITFTKRYSGICGITMEDLDIYFGMHMEGLRMRYYSRYEGCLQNALLASYGGYSWDGKTQVLNPYSLLSFFSEARFACYWQTGGTPKYMTALAKKCPDKCIKLKKYGITELILDMASINKISFGLMLFQAGYLAVKEVTETRGTPYYLLDVPNFEARDALIDGLGMKIEYTDMFDKELDSKKDGRKIIFLDIDGVLQPPWMETRFDYDLKALQKQMAEENQQDEYLRMDRYDIGAVYYDWEPNAVTNLKKLIDWTGAEIVVSSDWRYSNKLDWLRLLFKIHELDVFVKGTTPCRHYDRKQEINTYLSECNDITNYVVIDDMNLSQHFPDNFVYTADTGFFAMHHIEKAIRILSQP
ncbi:MAG: AAA family ATPase [Clostridiales bacterium]|nr:AAA family ATPase [Clostridiales bacterium]